MKLLSFVIPVFRNQASIAELYEALCLSAKQLAGQYESEWMFIDDGSDDNSLQLLLTLQKDDARIKIISLSRNFGQVPAIIAGLHEVSGDGAIIMSADLQEPFEVIAELIKGWEENNEVVIAYRSERNDGLLAKTASAVFYRLIKIEHPAMPVGGFDFLLLGRKAIDSLNLMKEKNRFLQGDILWMGYPVKFIPYTRKKRHSGKSQQKLSWKMKYFMDGLLNTSYWPIRLSSAIGLFTFAAGLIYALVIVYLRLVHATPFKGWAPLMIIILLIGGLNMLTLGLIGEYLWRIYDETKTRPGYIIKQRYFKK